MVIKDFVTGKDLAVGELVKMADAAEKRPEMLFNMSGYFVSVVCGTSCCLVGTYLADVVHRCPADKSVSSVFDEYVPMPEREYGFLFYQHDGRGNDAVLLRKKEAIARLRKYIAYKLRKAKLLEDYESARRMSDCMFTSIPQADEEIRAYLAVAV